MTYARPMPLRGRRILVVEDDYVIADDIRATLEGLGAEVMGPAASLRRAFALVREGRPDGAVLDVNLGGEMVFPLADHLRVAGVPMLFATGYDRPSLPPAYADIPHCEKPTELAGSLGHLLA